MARRRAANDSTGPVFGALGPFRRTEEAWRALGAPPSLYDRAAACAAVARCAKPAYSRAFILGAPDPPAAGLNFVAQEWWMAACPFFLIARNALTTDERLRIEREPVVHGSTGSYDRAALEIELFGAPV